MYSVLHDKLTPIDKKTILVNFTTYIERNTRLRHRIMYNVRINSICNCIYVYDFAFMVVDNYMASHKGLFYCSSYRTSVAGNNCTPPATCMCTPLQKVQTILRILVCMYFRLHKTFQNHPVHMRDIVEGVSEHLKCIEWSQAVLGNLYLYRCNFNSY